MKLRARDPRHQTIMPLLRTLLLLLCIASSARADVVTVPARLVDFRPQIHAWARVESVAPLELRAPIAARVARVTVVQGQAVTPGTPLVQLAGPQVVGRLAAVRARVAATRRELDAAREEAASVRRNYPTLADRRALAAAQATLAAAQGRFAEANAAEQTLRAQILLSSPVPAIVNAVSVAPGVDLPAGAPLLTLLPRGHLWLRAELFGVSLPPASQGIFRPDEGPSIAVRLVDELPARAANGARILNFAPLGTTTDWQAGETGELTISGAPRPAVAVPAGALILDAGRWYVLTESAGKLTAVRVTPGPARGDEMLILAGLQPGTPVVVRQAYLLYHRDIASHYTPPD